MPAMKILYFGYFLWLCFENVSGSQLPLRFLQLQRKAFEGAPKKWFLYMYKFLHQYIEKSFVLNMYFRNTNYLTYLRHVTRRYSVIFKHSKMMAVHVRERTVCTKTDQVTFPVGKITQEEQSPTAVQECKQINKIDYDYQVSIWQFTLDNSVRLNITFNYIKITFSTAHDCYYGAVQIQGMNYLSQYCGMHADVINYPTHYTVKVLISTKPHVSYNLTYTYQVIDSDKIVHHMGPWWQPEIKFKSYYTMQEYRVEQFYIVTEKYKFLTIRLFKIFSIEVYDGPGILSKLIKPTPTFPIDYVASTFQCQVYCYQTEILDLIFRSENRGINREISLALNKSLDIAYPNEKCNNFCTVKLKTDSHLKVYVSIKALQHTYLVNLNCAFGGIATYTVTGLRYELIKSECFSSGTSFQYRNMYSSSSSMLMIIHSYSKYGNMNLSLTMSTTRCSHVTENPCAYSFYCLEGYMNRYNCDQVRSIYRMTGDSHQFYFKFLQMRASPVKVERNQCLIVQFSSYVDKFMYGVISYVEYSQKLICRTKNFQMSIDLARHYEVTAYNPKSSVASYTASLFFKSTNSFLVSAGKGNEVCFQGSDMEKYESNINIKSCSTNSSTILKKHPNSRHVFYSLHVSSDSKTMDLHPHFDVQLRVTELYDWVDILVEHNYISSTIDHPFDLMYPIHEVMHINTSEGRLCFLDYQKKARDQGLFIYLLSQNKYIKFKLTITKSLMLPDWSATKMFVQSLTWSDFIQLSPGNPGYVNALPGSTENVTVDIMKTNASGKVKFYWLENIYDRFLSQISHPRQMCTQHGFSMNYSKHEYTHYYAYMLPYCPSKLLNTKKYLNGSWYEAAKLCQSAGGHLPVIKDDTDLKEIISYMLHSDSSFPDIEIMFIGLTTSPERSFMWQTGDPVGFQMWKNINFRKKTVTSYKFSYTSFDMTQSFFQLGTAAKRSNGSSFVKPIRDMYFDTKIFNADFVKRKTQHTLYPQIYQPLCAAMLLSNLAEPEWITIDCNEQVSPHAFCAFSTNNNTSDVNATRIHPDLVLYEKICVLKKDVCFTYLWTDYKDIDKLANAHRYKTHDTNFTHFQYLFDAVGDVLPPFLTTDMESLTVYKTYSSVSHIVHYDIDHNNKEGLQISALNPLNLVIGDNLFHCQNNTYVSIQLLCDGNADCPGKTPLDEVGCTCNATSNYSPKCKIINNSRNTPTCSLFYFTSRDASCYQIDFSKATETIDKTNIAANIFQCFNGMKIEVSLVNDLVPDCSDASDENLLKNLSVTKSNCSNRNQIQCRKGHPHCYDIFEICSYKLNDKYHLHPCRTGEHLKNCTFFECNMMYKCPGYYCIPWAYICDGKWDCPHGVDEGYQHNCGKKRKCKNMFKCKGGAICIHVGDICNNNIDCPLGDDEHMCALKDTVCPSVCQCLAFLLSCRNVDATNYITSTILPYHGIFLENSDEIVTVSLLKSLAFITVVSLKNNNLSSICFNFPSTQYLVSITVTLNGMEVIQSACFTNLMYLRTMNLRANKIHQINSYAFSNLSSLSAVDLSENNLMKLPSNIFIRVPGFKLLIIKNNSLADTVHVVFADLNLKYLITNDYHSCCLVSNFVRCSSKRPWHFTCSGLLKSNVLRFYMYSTSIIIITLGFLSTGVQNLRQEGELQKPTPFKSIATSISMSSILCGAYLIILSMTDLRFKETFPFEILNWKSSFTCLLSFGTILFYIILSPSLLTLLALSRFMVVKYPMDSKFKGVNFVQKYISAIYITALALTLTTVLLMRLIYFQMPFKLCLPFIDPNHSNTLTISLTLITLNSHLVLLTVIIVVSIKLALELRKSSKKFEKQRFNSKTKHSMLIQITVLISSNIICWVGSDVVFLLALILDRYSIAMIEWTTVVIVPINAVVVPFVFIINALRQLSLKADNASSPAGRSGVNSRKRDYSASSQN